MMNDPNGYLLDKRAMALAKERADALGVPHDLRDPRFGRLYTEALGEASRAMAREEAEAVEAERSPPAAVSSEAREGAELDRRAWARASAKAEAEGFAADLTVAKFAEAYTLALSEVSREGAADERRSAEELEDWRARKARAERLRREGGGVVGFSMTAPGRYYVTSAGLIFDGGRYVGKLTAENEWRIRSGLPPRRR
jgi:hypothetical protein